MDKAYKWYGIDTVEQEEEEDFDSEVYDEGFYTGKKIGYHTGFDEGFDCGYEEAKAYNIILDGEILDEIYNFKEQILSYRKEPWSENETHNRMILVLHRGLIELTETWVMNQVWNYWNKEESEN